ncbi:hypothetical protein DY000_02032613 [Brassica cretica]|uniref:Uncharacterized protein n=1 Tax=Brassica cretica TaxID=69181 RepID=A0ABQ7DND4_BRACR|nr:hypothetical protein DY000_02032613 [Brassica cretica]
MSSEVYYRSWMDKPHLDPNTNLLTEEYVQGIGEFMRLVQQQPDAKSGFSRNYKVWYLHGETGYEYGSTSEPQPVSEPQPDIRLEESRTDIDYGVVNTWLPYKTDISDVSFSHTLCFMFAPKRLSDMIVRWKLPAEKTSLPCGILEYCQSKAAEEQACPTKPLAEEQDRRTKPEEEEQISDSLIRV